MADKQVEIEVVTKAALDEVEDLDNLIQEAKEHAGELGDSLSDIDPSKLDESSEDANELADSTDNAKEKVDELADSMGLIDSAVMMDMANQIGQLGDNAEGMAQDMNAAAITVGQLATNVGVAEPQMISLINNISNATFPQNEAMAYVQALNQMGVSADKLGDSATNMDKINDATGIGYTKVMQLTQGLRSVGIEADNLPSSFNAIAYAQANVNGGADTLTTVLKRQASTINEYGLSVDQVVIIMQKLSEQGVQGMKMGSALSSILKETNGDTRALEQSLGLTAGTLSNASSVTGQYSGQLQALANEEAEHKTWLDQINAAWEDMQLTLTPVLSPLTSLLGLIGSFGQTALAINSLLTLAETFGLLNTAELTLIPTQIAEGAAGWFSIGWIVVAIALGIALGLALIYLYNHSEKFRNAVNWLGAKLQWLAGLIVTNVMNAVNQFRNIIQGIPQAIQACLDWGYQLIMSHPIVRAAVWLGQAIANGFSALGLGQHSPGKIVKAMRQELDWTEDVIVKSSLANTTAKLGNDVANGFKPNLNNSANNIISASNQSKGDFIVNVYGDIDNDKRITQICDEISRRINWDNTTAGRKSTI